MNHSNHSQTISQGDQHKFIPIRCYQNSEDSENIITIQDNPEFGLTFGRPQAQLINELFDTPPTKIHTKLLPPKNIPKNHNNQTFVPLRNRAQSALNDKLSSKQLDLQKLRQNMSRITYSIKTIQCKNDQEIGVTSRRVIMANKLLETQKNFLNIKFNITRYRSTSHTNDENHTQESRFESEKPHKVSSIIPHNKFHSKRLNVIVKRKKSNFPKELENLSNSLKHFDFDDLNNDGKFQSQLNAEIDCQQSNIKSIEGIDKITFRNMKENRPATIENKRLKYETLMAKKSSQKFNTNKQKIITDAQMRIPFGQKLLLPNQGQLMSERKRKVSLSNILSQYHTQIIENSNNVLIERNNLCQPLKQLFKNKFSTISKTIHYEGKHMLKKNLMKIKMRKNILSRRGFNNQIRESRQNGMVSARQFRKYEELQKENACLLDQVV